MEKEIYEVSFEEQYREPLRWAYREVAGILPPGVTRMTSPLFDIGRIYKLMDGAIDLQVLTGPEAYATRLYDDMEIAIQACQAGMGAIVCKCLSMPSARSTVIVQKLVNQWADEHSKHRTDIFGSVVLGHAVGGLNPEAVLCTAKIGGKVVYLPTVDASHANKVLGKPGGIDVLDENDNIVPPLKEVFSLIAEADLVLNLGHQSTKEAFILIDEARKMDIKKIVVLHPNQPINKMTIEQMKIAADKGAYLALWSFDFTAPWFYWDEFMKAYEVVGPDRIVTGSDQGVYRALSPVEVMRAFIAGMLYRGIPDNDVEKMVKTNARTLLY